MQGSGMKQVLNRTFIYMASLNCTIMLLAMFLITILTDAMEDGIISFVRSVRLPGIRTIGTFLNGYFSTDVHASGWFKLLLILFTLNLLACMAKRMPATLTVLAAPASEEACSMPAAPFLEEPLTAGALRPDFEQSLQHLLTKLLARPVVHRDADRSVFFSQRGKCFHGGFYLAHGGLLCVLAGGLLGQSSLSGEMFLREGDIDDKVFFHKNGIPCFGKLDYSIRLDSCVPVDPARTAYRSTVTLVREGAADTRGALEGYQTLAAHGIRIGQARAPEKDGPQLMLSVQATKAGGKRRTFSLGRHQCCSIPETGHTVRLKDVFVSRDHPNTRLKKAAPAASSPCAATLEVYGKDRSLLYKPLVASYPVSLAPPGQEEYEFRITGVEDTESSSDCMRLLISTEPGASLIWLGAAIAIAGFSLIFLLSHRKIWVAIDKCVCGYSITIAGWTSRNPDILNYYAGLIKDLIRHYRTA
jgi:cytochrome c biogenesis protein